MRKSQSLPLIGAFILTSACGALFNSGPAHVSFNSNPTGAEVWIDGTLRGSTPLNLDLPKKHSYSVVMKKPGFQDATYNLERKVGTTWIILDVLGGILPVVVDAATGDWYTLSTDNVLLNLPPRTGMLEGRLTPEQLAAVRLGTKMDNFVHLPSPAVN